MLVIASIVAFIDDIGQGGSNPKLTFLVYSLMEPGPKGAKKGPSALKRAENSHF